jgi:predicted ATPase
MRIAFSGAACTGKTTTIQAFLQKWPNYKLIDSDYRKVVKESKKHSKRATPKSQREILDILCKEGSPYTLHDKVVYDRCAIDNLVYSLWSHGNGVKGFTEKFIAETIEKVRESMRNLDIIFVSTRDKMPPVIEQNGVRETDYKYIDETNNIFKAIAETAQTGITVSPFFPKDDSPAVILLDGTTDERIEQIGLYVTSDGDLYGEEKSILDPEEIDKMYRLLADQKDILTDEQKEKLGLLDFTK